MMAAGLFVLLLSGSSPGCAGDLVILDRAGTPSYGHRGVGYVIAHPPQEDSQDDWSPIRVEGADLAFRHATGPAISMSSSCRKTRATPSQLARHLMIGTPDRKSRAAGRLDHHGNEGWWQMMDSVENGEDVRIKTVTLVGGGCVFDWVLISSRPATFVAVEPLFDRWWASFESRAPGHGGEESAP